MLALCLAASGLNVGVPHVGRARANVLMVPSWYAYTTGEYTTKGPLSAGLIKEVKSLKEQDEVAFLGKAEPIELSEQDRIDKERLQNAMLGMETSDLLDVTEDDVNLNDATPEAAAPEAVTPEDAVPEAVTPEDAVPEAVTPEAAAPEAVTPEDAIPEDAIPEDAATSEAARLRKMDEAIAKLICPLTKSLPIDPVMAEDGRVYERSAIMQFLTQQLKSPTTGRAMGAYLVTAHSIRDMIRGMVESGALTGEKLGAWTTRLANEERMAQMRRKADAGDGFAMYELGAAYHHGGKGFDQNLALAVEWYGKSRDAGDLSGTAALGQCYAESVGVRQCKVRASMLLGIAADQGSQAAAYLLGTYFADGSHGFPQDFELARSWYTKVVSAKEVDIGVEDVLKVARWLRHNPAA